MCSRVNLNSSTPSSFSSIEELEEFDEVIRDHTPLLILIGTFLIALIVGIYMNIRMIVIMIRRFEREKHYSYYPMLVLMNFLSILSLIILVAACFLPYMTQGDTEGLNYSVIIVPFIYALVTPTLIASADLILCIHRVISHRTFGPKPNRWINIVIFVILTPLIGYISFKGQAYTLFLDSKKNDSWLLVAFVTENIVKAICSIGSFLGYCLIFTWSKRHKQFDSIIRQALPISGFQALTIIAQIAIEILPFGYKLSVYERLFLNIIFSAACSVAVPLCTMMGETHKREMFYSSLCCCYCYCEPRPPAPKRRVYQTETGSRVERQKMEEEEARSRREEERRKRQIREFSSLEESVV